MKEDVGLDLDTGVVDKLEEGVGAGFEELFVVGNLVTMIVPSDTIDMA